MKHDYSSHRARLGAGTLAAVALVLTVVWPAAAAAASPAGPSALTVGVLPTASANGSVLEATDCTSNSFCMAVGGNGSALSERWDGVEWVSLSTPDPAGASDVVLRSVQCTSSSACVAVGGWSKGTTTAGTLAESWNGESWSILATPALSGAVPATGLTGISCSSPGWCMGVGYYTTSDGTSFVIAETWNGHNWTLVSVPRASGPIGHNLQGVSCTSDKACVAVGTNRTAGTLAESWNGTNWAIEATPNPVDATDSAFNGVSCIGAVCVAVGYYQESGLGEVTLAESWNGKEWVIHASSPPTRADVDSFQSVSCVSAYACMAVGINKSGETLAKWWNSNTWSTTATPVQHGTIQSALNGVSCLSASACLGVGYAHLTSSSPTLAERWNGTRWFFA